jgi:hypothetical protein
MPIDMHALARLGAQTRITALVAEIDALLETFPDLGQERARSVTAASTEKNPSKRGRPTARANTSAQADAAPATRTRKPMSAAAKKAVGERMKAYWAKRKVTASVLVTEPATASTVAKPAGKPTTKRTLSAEGRAKISAAEKSPWKAQRKAKKAA